METALALLGALWMLLVPGLPIALLLRARGGSWWGVGALSPLFSIGAAFVLLQVVNRLGLTPPLRLYGLLITAGTVAATWLVMRNRPGLGRPPRALLLSLVPVGVAGVLWGAGMRGYALLAPNADAVNHNLWIARIMSEGSALGADVRVASPLQDSFAGPGFYPLAWHAEAATAAAVFGVPAPTMSFVSTFVCWSLVLTLGLVAVARRISETGVLWGVTSAALVQTVPLVPGVPMTWGAMTTVVGVALLPAGLYSVITFYEVPGWRSVVSLGAVGSTLFVAHSPEAATTAVLAVTAGVVLAVRRQLQRQTAILLGVLGVAVLLAAGLALSTIRASWDELSALLGGNDRSINESLGSFLTSSINVPSTQLFWGGLVISGAWLAASRTRGPWLAVAVGSTLCVYLVSGANTEPLLSFRRLTVPWYGSYERTAWVALPFLALLAALPVVTLVLHGRRQGLRSGASAMALASLLVGVQAWIGGEATLVQLRKGVAENQVAGPGSRAVFDEARRLSAGGGLVISQPGDGSIYAYSFDGVEVSNGPYDSSGTERPELAGLLVSLRDICADRSSGLAIERFGVVAILVGTRSVAWAPPTWTEAELRDLPGMRVVSSSRDLFLLAPETGLCQ